MMIGLYVSAPIACFRPGAAREFWESHPLAPPSTVYGFLLSLVGETDRTRHRGARCTAGLIETPDRSTVLRRLWRVKDRKTPPGSGVNVRPDFQQLLTKVRLTIFLDSSDENIAKDSLEERVLVAMDPKLRKHISRFGGLSLGESCHLVDEVTLISKDKISDFRSTAFLLGEHGGMTLPIWVDHVGAAGTRYATGDLEILERDYPPKSRIPQITDEGLMC